MIRYRLSNFIKKSVGIQLFISIMPIMLAILYISFYMIDLTMLITSFENNNRYVSQDILSDVIKEVSNFEENVDGSYSVILQDEQSSEEEIGVGDTIFTLSIIKDSWYQLITKSGARLTLTGCELFEVEPQEDGSFKIIVNDSSFIVNSGDIVCDVILNKDEGYTVNFNTDSIDSIEPDYISSLQLIMRNKDKYRIKVVSAYETELDNIAINFCTNLPTDSVYYNEVSQVFLKNVSRYFKVQFILDSNIIIALISILVLSILIHYMGVLEDIKYFKRQDIFIANIFGVVVISFCILTTFLLL